MALVSPNELPVRVATRSNFAMPTSSQFRPPTITRSKASAFAYCIGCLLGPRVASEARVCVFTLRLGFVANSTLGRQGLSRVWNLLSSTNHVHHRTGRAPRRRQHPSPSSLGAAVRHRPSAADSVGLSTL